MTSMTKNLSNYLREYWAMIPTQLSVVIPVLMEAIHYIIVGSLVKKHEIHHQSLRL